MSTADLFTIDFDLEAEEKARAACQSEEQRFSSEDILSAVDAARREAHEEGRQQGLVEGRAAAEAEISARASTALEAAIPALDTVLQSISDHRAHLENHLSTFALSVCAKVFPQALSKLGPDRVAAEVEAMVSMVMPDTKLVVTLSPLTAAKIEVRIMGATEKRHMHRLIVRHDTAMNDTDVTVSWDDGFMKFSYEAVCTGILNVLREISRTTKT